METLTDQVMAKLQAGAELVVHTCSLCGYACCYLYDSVQGLGYDRGCHCTGRYVIEPRTQAQLEQHIVLNREQMQAWIAH